MVRMIPAQHGAIESQAEERLWDVLSESGDGWDASIIHSLETRGTKDKFQTEVDFVVFVPSKGIVIIECKGATSATISGSQWQLKGVPAKSQNDNPFHQIDAARRAVRGMLKQSGFENVDLVPIARLAWFPWMTRSTLFDSKGEFKVWEIALGEELQNPKEAILRALEEEKKSMDGNRQVHYKPSTLTSSLIDDYIGALRTEMQIDADPAFLSLERERLLAKATREQALTLELVAKNNFLFFDGDAGTGKTVLLNECAISWLKEGRRVLYVCFNEMLAEQIRAKIGRVNGIDVYSFNQLLLRLAGLEKNPKDAKPSWWDVDLPQLALATMDKSGYSYEYEGLCIDEFQDLVARPHIFDAIMKTIGGRNRPPRIAVAADDGQQISSAENRVSAFNFITSRNNRFVHVMLTTNCRQAPKLTSQIDVLLGRTSRIKRHRMPQNTDCALEVISTTKDKEAKDLYKILVRLLKTYKPENIRVLSPYGEKGSLLATVAKSFDNDSKEIRELKKLTTFPKDGGKIHWRSVRKFKGLEDDVVVVTDVSHVTRDYLLGQQNRILSHLYVALSRARFHAIVLTQDNMFPATHNVAGAPLTQKS